MNKKRLSAVCTALVLAFSVLGASACSIDTAGDLYYPDYGYADAGSDSWAQIEDLEEEVDITWYVDSSSLTFSNELIEIISEKFNVNITPRKPVNDDGSELSGYIMNNTLPDVITITDYSTIVQLGENGYVYPLQKLAEKYAPSMLARIPEEMVSFWGDDEDLIYGWPANFYSDADLESLDAIGSSLMSNYAVLVRKDYLEAYLAAHPGAEENAVDPQGFIEMSLWVKEHFGLASDNPTVCLENFTTDSTTEASRAITALSEFFAVPMEDAEGNLTYRWDQAQMKEMMMFLNELYRNRLITSGNLSATSAQVGTYIQNGLPFAVIGATQNYQSPFRNLYINSNNQTGIPIEYVPIVLTNAAKDMPVLSDISGRGNRLTMISGNCERVDRIIKVFDYLISETGHRETYFGEEGKTYTVEKQPGETGTVLVGGQSTEYTYPYGQMKWTNLAWNAYQHYNYIDLKIHTYSYLQNPLYAYLADYTGQGHGFITMANYMNYNHKAAYMPLTYSKIPFKFNLDSSAGNYTQMVTLQSSLELHWLQYISKIIMAATEQEASSLYDKALSDAHSLGSNSLLAFQNESFLKLKQSMGLDFAWPKNRSDYSNIKLGLLGDTSYVLDVPDNVNFTSYDGGDTVYTVD